MVVLRASSGGRHVGEVRGSAALACARRIMGLKMTFRTKVKHVMVGASFFASVRVLRALSNGHFE